MQHHRSQRTQSQNLPAGRERRGASLLPFSVCFKEKAFNFLFLVSHIDLLRFRADASVGVALTASCVPLWLHDRGHQPVAPMPPPPSSPKQGKRKKDKEKDEEAEAVDPNARKDGKG